MSHWPAIREGKFSCKLLMGIKPQQWTRFDPKWTPWKCYWPGWWQRNGGIGGHLAPPKFVSYMNHERLWRRIDRRVERVNPRTVDLDVVDTPGMSRRIPE